VQGTACVQAVPCTLQTATAQALAGDLVYLAAGTYRGVGAGAVVTVTRGYTLYGGWDSVAAGPVWRDPNAYRSVVDGQNVRQGVKDLGYADRLDQQQDARHEHGFPVDEAEAFASGDQLCYGELRHHRLQLTGRNAPRSSRRDNGRRAGAAPAPPGSSRRGPG
jgi:hypothetical protein